MRAGQMMLNVTAHNVANVNTVGYLSGRMDSVELAYANLVQVDSGVRSRGHFGGYVENGTVELSRGHGVRPGNVVLSEGPGALQMTGVPTDLAIEGPGYFALVDEGGASAGYTRDGSFRMDAEGYLVHAGGAFLGDEDGNPIRVPREETMNRLEIDTAGFVHSVSAGGDAEPAGRLGLMVPGPGEQLVASGSNTYHLRDGDGVFVAGSVVAPAEASGSVRQGYLEGSNADLAEEMSRLIMAQRAFQLNARSLQTADDMFELVNHMNR